MFKKIAIAGLGLIGGSIAIAVKRKSPATEIIGITRNPSTIGETSFRTYFDVVTNYSELGVIRDSEILIISTIVSAIPETFRIIKPFVGPNTIITDVGSVKEWIVREINNSSFIGSHPMAGSEKSGIANANPHIFEGAICAITPLNNTKEQVETISRFWESLGMKTLVIPPDLHDKIVAETSHFVHLVVFIISGVLSHSEFAKNRFFEVFGKGLIDTTRIAKSDPNLWIEIFQKNKRNLLQILDNFTKALKKTINDISSDNWECVRDFLEKSRNFRINLEQKLH